MKGKSIQIADKEIVLPSSIEKVLEFLDLKIVLYYEFDCYPKVLENYSRNIWAFDKHGNLKWKVTSPNEGGYSNVWIDESGALLAYGGSGYTYEIDIKCGASKLWRDPSWPPGYKPRPW